MLNAIIIEDEKPAVEVLAKNLSELSLAVNVQARLHSVKEGIDYFSKETGPAADLIFCDVQLRDGLSFDIFERTGVRLPVVFITAYDQYITKAFENNGIDYLLKPVDKNDLEKAIVKYNNLRSHFLTPKHITPQFARARKRTRLLVKKGREHVTLLLDDVVLIYTQDKVVYVIDRFSKKYLTDKTLSDLESELDTAFFFRVNRQHIVNINFVKSFRAHHKVKLQVELCISDMPPLVISQETAPAFRKWMHDA